MKQHDKESLFTKDEIEDFSVLLIVTHFTLLIINIIVFIFLDNSWKLVAQGCNTILPLCEIVWFYGRKIIERNNFR